MKPKTWNLVICAIGLSLAVALPVQAQQVLLDKPIKAGELTVFPDLNDETVYYYVSDKPRLSINANGQPQFSFLRYVDNVRTGADQPESREGDGGGIVHALVTLSVAPDQIRDAQRALQRLKPGAKINGPVVFRSGKFGLVSSFKDPDGKLSTKVVGLGNAPILDGEKAAVSMQLTKQGAKILWESFHTAAPDISFSFEMDMAGYRSPQRAVIEANFDQIYEHQAFGAGVASTYLAAEIKAAFDDLKRQGAIKLTQVGENEKLEALITTAYNKIADLMFSPLGGTGTPSLDSMTAATSGQGSLLDRATTLLQQSRQDARTENERIRTENERIRAEKKKAEQERRAAEATRRPQPPVAGSSEPPPGSLEQDRPAATADTPPHLVGTHPFGSRPGDPVDEPRAEKEEVPVPSFAVVAAFEMKKVHQQGVFKVDLNKYTADHITLRFDENIGDLRQYLDKPDVFRDVNLDDPLYRQREIVVSLDGLNGPDFGKYVNFVSVQMRKQHAEGAVTTDEVRIDRANYTKEGNQFKLLYGWKGDNDRRRWEEFEYRPVWSFFGGGTVEEKWQKWTANGIAVKPPYTRRQVDIQGDPKAVADAGIRSITVRLFYDLAGKQQVKQVTLNVSKGQLSEQVEFMAPPDKTEYDYEIVWQLKGNRTVSSGRKTNSTGTLFVDELPAS
jgi:hypothetical protein